MAPHTLKPFNINSLLAPASPERKVVSFGKKQVIFSQGDRNDSVFFIEKGTVKLTVTSKQGREAVLGLMNGGAVFGESCIASDLQFRPYNAIALTDTRTVKIRRSAVVRILRNDGESSYVFITYLLERMVRLQEDLVSNLLDASEKRLARTLLYLGQFRESNKLELPRGVNQQTLAEMIGASRQRVNFLMKDFRKSVPLDDAAGAKVRRSQRKLVASRG
jgi:CRP-like cAMP-binding protein